MLPRNLRKHRDYCGDITNHIGIMAMTRLSDDEVDTINDEESEDYEEIVILNEEVGEVPYRVEMGWKTHDGGFSDKTYEYVIYVIEPLPSDKPDKKETDSVKAIAQYIEEENARRREAGEEQITDEG